VDGVLLQTSSIVTYLPVFGILSDEFFIVFLLNREFLANWLPCSHPASPPFSSSTECVHRP